MANPPNGNVAAIMVDSDHNQGTPIRSETLVFGSHDDNHDEAFESQRKVAFDRFQSMVESLAAMENGEDHPISLIWHSDREVHHTHVVPINSILVHAKIKDKLETETVVVIVPSSEKVDLAKLEAHLISKEDDDHDERIPTTTARAVQCSLVPAHQVEDVCGFLPGSVPPMGHKIPLRTVIESSLYHNTGDNGLLVLGGGGHSKIGCLISVETLLRIEGTELADIITVTSNVLSHESSTTNGGTSSESEEHANSSSNSRHDNNNQPYFQMAPPCTKLAHEIIFEHPSLPIPLQPQPITVVGRIHGIRRMARRLVFVDLAPPGFVGTGTKVDSFLQPWRSVVDHEEMSVQLIIGKTFFKQQQQQLIRGGGDEGGDAAATAGANSNAEEALKRLKVGQLLLVEGRTNVGNRESLRHWVDKRSLDIVVADYQLLLVSEEAPHQTPTLAPSANAIGKSKRKQKQTKSRNLTTAKTPDNGKAKEYLKLADIFGQEATIQIVDDRNGVTDFEKTLAAAIRPQFSSPLSASTATINDNNDTPSLPILVGLDCEWKPNFLMDWPNQPQPVLLLQISFHNLRSIYLWDLQALLRPCLPPTEPMTDLETVASQALSKLFSSSQMIKTGFQLTHDLKNLAGSYPHIPAFRSVSAVVEVASIVKRSILQQSSNTYVEHQSKQVTSSLSKLTNHLLGKPIHKAQQVSDWSSRPLSEAQREYAALDAAVTPALLEKAMADSHNNDKIGNHSWLGAEDALMSMRFELVEERHADPAALRKRNAKQVVSHHWLLAQSWPTGQEPPTPRVVVADGTHGMSELYL